MCNLKLHRLKVGSMFFVLRRVYVHHSSKNPVTNGKSFPMQTKNPAWDVQAVEGGVIP